MKRHVPQQHTGRVVAVALVFFGALVALGLANGVFTRLDKEEVLALAAFALAFAVATYVLDATVREWVGALLRRGAAVRKSPAKSPGGTRAAT